MIPLLLPTGATSIPQGEIASRSDDENEKIILIVIGHIQDDMHAVIKVLLMEFENLEIHTPEIGSIENPTEDLKKITTLLSEKDKNQYFPKRRIVLVSNNMVEDHITVALNFVKNCIDELLETSAFFEKLREDFFRIGLVSFEGNETQIDISDELARQFDARFPQIERNESSQERLRAFVIARLFDQFLHEYGDTIPGEIKTEEESAN